MVPYLLKASAIAAVLLAFYKLFLEKESFFSTNRIYLIGGIVLTFFLPFISLPPLVDEQGFISTLIERAHDRETLSSATETLPQSTPADANTVENLPVYRHITWVDWVIWLYYFGVAVFLLNLFIQVTRILMVAGSSNDKLHDTDGVIINSSSVQEPCSFFRYIFINPEKYDYDTYEQIIAHEKVHVKRLHAADLLLGEVAVSLLWFNPIVWMFRRAVEKNIEYETDDLLLKGRTFDREGYQMNLLKIATHRKPLAITINYNQSLIKQRILRMNTRKSSPHSYWKYAFSAPLILVLLLVINKPISMLAGSGNESAHTNQGEPKHASDGNECAELLRAAKDQNIEKVKQLLKTVNPNCYYMGDGEPRSPLVAAARRGDLAMGQLMIDAGADVEFHAPGDETPLMAAAAIGHLDFVKLLLANAANVNKRLRGDGSALLVASRKGRLETVKYLISQGADINAQIDGDGTPLICAVKNNHYEVSRVLLENGADPFLVSPGDEYAMYHARISGNKAMIDLMEKYRKDN